jgi:uncharacterized protein YbcI
VSIEDASDAHGASRPLDDDHEPRATTLTQVTRAIVAVYKEQFGRGPRHAHSHFAGPDTLICLLEGSLTPVERTIASLGEHQRLRDIRQLFQQSAEQEMRGAVEEISGRRVVAFTSGMDTISDVASEVFVLESAEERRRR